MNINKFFTDIYLDATLYAIFITYALLNFHPTPASFLAIFIVFISLSLWLIARIQLGSAFSLTPQANKLVVKGIYSKIRHPIYTFTFLANVGIIYLLGNRYLYLLIPLNLALQFYRAKREDSLLEKTFGQPYLDYKKGTIL